MSAPTTGRTTSRGGNGSPPTAVRPPDGGPGSPLLDLQPARRRPAMPRPPKAGVAIVVALVVLAVVVVVTTVGGSDKRGAARPAPTGRTPAAAPQPGPVVAAQRPGDREVDSVLRYTPFVTAGSKRKREVALTFDDGPSPYTAAIIKTLREKHATATFFIVGQQLNSFASVLRDEVRQGFEVGDHTENHKFLPALSPARQYGQVNDGAIRIRQLGGAYPRLFRPPYGGIGRKTFRVLHGVRMLTVLWSVDPADWRRPGAATIVSRVLSQVQPGSIVILHDGGGYRDQTVSAVPAIVDGLAKRHFAIVGLSQLLRDDPPPKHQTLPHLTGQ